MGQENPIFRQLSSKIAVGENIEKQLEIQRKYALEGAMGSMSSDDFQALERLKIRKMANGGFTPAPSRPDYSDLPNAGQMEAIERNNIIRKRSDRQARELDSSDTLVYQNGGGQVTPIETHARTPGGTLLPAGSKKAEQETAKRYRTHRHGVDSTTGDRIGSANSAPEDGHVVNKEGQLVAKPSPSNDGVIQARLATQSGKKERKALIQTKQETGEWNMKPSSTPQTDAYRSHT